MRTVISCICLFLLLGNLEVQGVDLVKVMTKKTARQHLLFQSQSAPPAKKDISEEQNQNNEEENVNFLEVEEMVVEGATAGTTAIANVATTTAATLAPGSSGNQDTSAILDSYRDLEERVGKLESGGVQRQVQAGDAIAAAKADAEAMIRAALQDVADGAQAQAAAAAAAAADQAAQQAANAANAANSGGSGTGGAGGGSTTATNGNGGTGTGTNGGSNGGTTTGSNNGGGSPPSGGSDTTGGCCANPVDQVARSENAAASQQIADMAAKIASLQSIIAGLTTTPVVSTVAATASNGGGGGGDNAVVTNPSTAGTIVTGLVTPTGGSQTSTATTVTPTTTTGGTQTSTATVTTTPTTESSSTGGSSIIESGTSTGTTVDPAVLDEQQKAHAAATQALLNKLNLNDKLNIDPNVIQQSAKLVSDLGNKQADFLDSLQSDCSEPTCPVPAGIPISS